MDKTKRYEENVYQEVDPIHELKWATYALAMPMVAKADAAILKETIFYSPELMYQ